MGQNVRRRLIYHGRVQGVGFRATTYDIASGYPVAGYVRNLPGGTVELVAEGPIGNVEAFLAAVQSHFFGHISRIEAQPVQETEPLSGFTIRP
jgi:acylphosphatase